MYATSVMVVVRVHMGQCRVGHLGILKVGGLISQCSLGHLGRCLDCGHMGQRSVRHHGLLKVRGLISQYSVRHLGHGVSAQTNGSTQYRPPRAQQVVVVRGHMG